MMQPVQQRNEVILERKIVHFQLLHNNTETKSSYYRNRKVLVSLERPHISIPQGGIIMNMKKAIVAMLACSMLLGLTACGGSSTASTTAAAETEAAEEAATEAAEAAETEAAEAADDGEVKTIYIYQMKTEIQDALEAVTAKYTETHPNVQFICESASDNYSTSLKAMFQGGNAPDIFSIQGYSDAVLWQDQLEDLTGEAWTSDMIDASAENVTIDGSVYAFPFSVEAAGYVYNTALFEQAGITEVPTTPEALQEAVEKLAAAGVAEPITECYMDWYQLGNFMINLGFAGQEDSKAFIAGLADGTTSFVDNDVWKELASYISMEYSISTNPSTTDFNTQTSLVGSQDIAITIGGNWSQPTYDGMDPDLPVSLMGIPYSSNEAENDQLYLVGTYWGVNKNSEVKPEVKEFLNWLTGTEEGQECLTKDLQIIPAYNSIEADPEAIGVLGQAVEEYIAAGKVDNEYNTFFPDGFAQASGEACQKLAAGKCTEEEFLQELQDQWTSLSE